jgi:Cytochrome c biogenesis factor
MLAYFRRGQTYQRRGERGDLEAAARDFRTAAGLDPAATRPLEALGDVLFQSQQYDRAVSAYERCARLDDRSARITYKLALARFRARDIDASIAALRDTLRLDERSADAHYLLGVCLREQHRVPDAIKALEQRSRSHPDWYRRARSSPTSTARSTGTLRSSISCR